MRLASTYSTVSNGHVFANIKKLFSCISPRRKVQILLLFLMQLMNAVLEIFSIGSIVPFLGALTDIKKLMANHYIIVFTDWVQISDPQQLIMILALIFGAGVIAANIFRFLTLLTQQYLSAAIAVDLGKMLYFKTLHKPYQFFLVNNTSHLIGNTTNDLSGTLGILYGLFSIVTQGLIAIFIITSLFLYNTKIALILSITIVASYSLIMLLVNRRLRRNSLVVSDSYRGMVQALQEGYGGIRYIILDRLQENFANQYTKADRWFRRKNAENSIIMQAPRYFLESIGMVAMTAITISFISKDSNITEIIPLMGLLVFGCYRLLPAMQQIYASISSVISLSVSMQRVMDVISEPLNAEVEKSVIQPMKMKDSLQFNHVFFDYHGTGESWTIADMSFAIKAKTTVALVGHTGSGKSTISDLILGLIQPQKGQIMVDGIPLDIANTGKWQAGISHVPQAIFLSDTTIAENIAFGTPYDQIDMARVINAAKMAQLDSFIQTMPKKYDESVGERGVRLSGGQRQRIGIARALYQNPSLIVFDEATSALDNKTEQDFMQAINELKHNLTIILIAHRLSTVKNADNILVFEKGRLVAQGKYDELLQNEYFSKLVHAAEQH